MTAPLGRGRGIGGPIPPADARAGRSPARSETGPAEADPLERRIWSALRRIQDPELPVGIVDLGLVYDVRVASERVEVDLTHTAMGCPAIEMMQEDVESSLCGIPGVEEVCVRTVWDPPWTKARLTPRGRVALLASGIAI